MCLIPMHSSICEAAYRSPGNNTLLKAHFYENAGSAGILPVLFTAFSWFVVAFLAMGVGIIRSAMRDQAGSNLVCRQPGTTLRR